MTAWALPTRPRPSSQGEFVLTERWGDDDRPYLQTQNINAFTIWAYGKVANHGIGYHVRNVFSNDGAVLSFHVWTPGLPAYFSDPFGFLKARTSWTTRVFFDGKFEVWRRAAKVATAPAETHEAPPLGAPNHGAADAWRCACLGRVAGGRRALHVQPWRETGRGGLQVT